MTHANVGVEENYERLKASTDAIGEVVFNSRDAKGMGKPLIYVEIGDDWGEDLSDVEMVSHALNRIHRHSREIGPIRSVFKVERYD